MTATPITPYEINRNTASPLNLAAVTPTAADVANGNSVANSGLMFVDLHNTNGASTARTCGIALSGGKDGQPITPKSVSVAAGATVRLGPWPVDSYGGKLLLTGSHAELTIAAFNFAS